MNSAGTFTVQLAIEIGQSRAAGGFSLREHCFQISRLAGRSIDSCYLVALRSGYPDAPRDSDTTWHLLRLTNGAISEVAKGEGVVKAMWIANSPSCDGDCGGRIYLVGTRDGRFGLHVGTFIGDPELTLAELTLAERTLVEQTGVGWTLAPLESAAGGAKLTGVWGLRDDLVFAWGEGIFLFDGAAWRALALPGQTPVEAVIAVHGTSDRSVFAAGKNGSFFHWQDDQFRLVDPYTQPFTLAGVPFSRFRVVDEGAAALLKLAKSRQISAADEHARRATFGINRWSNGLYVAALDVGLLRAELGTFASDDYVLGGGNLHLGDTLIWSHISGVSEIDREGKIRSFPAERIGALIDAEYFPY